MKSTPVALIAVAITALVWAPAFAQHAAHPHPPRPGSYAGMHDRDIKALSSEQVADLREGRGMGASLPAELNGAPGPLHVLELSQQLQVTAPQRAALEQVRADMKASAQRLGAQVIAAEAELDQGFKAGSIDEKGIADATARIAALQGQLRAVHLVAHLKTKKLLTDAQVLAYNQARGYATADGPAHRH
jgi:hypothetical protein